MLRPKTWNHPWFLYFLHSKPPTYSINPKALLTVLSAYPYSVYFCLHYLHSSLSHHYLSLRLPWQLSCFYACSAHTESPGSTQKLSFRNIDKTKLLFHLKSSRAFLVCIKQDSNSLAWPIRTRKPSSAYLSSYISPLISFFLSFIQTTLISLLCEQSLCEYQPLEVYSTNSAQHAITMLQPTDTCCSFLLVLFALIYEWPDFSAQTSLNNNDNNDGDDDDDDNDSWLPTVFPNLFSTLHFSVQWLEKMTSTNCPI